MNSTGYGCLAISWLWGIGFIIFSFIQGSFFIALIGIAIIIFAIAVTNKGIVEPHKEKIAEKQEKLDAEKSLAAKQKMLAESSGLKKFDLMHTDEVVNYEKGIAAMRQLGIAMEQSVVQEKEKDWAIRGGLANGAAGPVAGIVTAVNTIKQNEAIRERNAANRAWGAQQRSEFFNLAAQVEKDKPKFMTMHEINSLYAAIFSWSPKTLFKRFIFRNIKTCQNKESGAVTVTADWTTLKDSVVIDGSFRAKLYDNNMRCVGCAYLNLPKIGSLKEKGQLSGICTGLPIADNYAVVIEPVDLWEFTSKKYENYPGEDNISLKEHMDIVNEYKKNYEAELSR